jgi:hypothetical protein
MNTAQFSAAVARAQDQSIRYIDDNGQHLQDTSRFDGYGLPDFKPVVCTLDQLAALIRWECSFLTGGMDQNALNNLQAIGRRKFTVVGEGA